MPTTPAETLSRPLRLPCGVTLPNRLAKSALSEGLADRDGHATPALERLFARLARGGAGLLITGNVMVQRNGLGEPGNVLVEETAPHPSLRAWAAAATAGGQACFVQLNHAGRQSPRISVRDPVAPSAIPLRLPGGAFAVPRALQEDEVTAIIRAFGRAAGAVKSAGFTGVQIHGAHGYLVSQFLSPLANHRDDRWGGSLENRMRFLVELYRAMRAEVGAAFPVTLKLNSADFLRGGFTGEEAVEVARVMDAEKLDLLEISGGTYEKPAMMRAPAPSTAEREAHFLEYARKIRAACRCPLMLTGGLRSPSVMAAIIEDGSVDLVGLGRPIALEPDFPREVLAGRMEPSRCPAEGHGALNGFVELGWYQEQLRRISAGKLPRRPGGAVTSVTAVVTSFARRMWQLRGGTLTRGIRAPDPDRR